MKKFLLKLSNIILTVIMIASTIYAVFNLVMTFLPTDIQRTVYGWLNMSSEYIATFSISATINAGVLIASKIGQTYSSIKLTQELTQAEQVNINTVQASEAILERQNKIINNLNVLQDLTNALKRAKSNNREKYQSKRQTCL